MHVQFFIPILEALRELGGSATPSELKDKLIEMLDISDEELEEKLKTGIYRIDNQITWSKIYLVRAELIDTSDPVVISLTQEGWTKKPAEGEVVSIFKEIHGNLVRKKGKPKGPKKDAGEDAVVEEIKQPHAQELLEVLRSLPPEGFERLCQRLLRASGFQKVIVRGRSGDGGIDGEGILEINPLVSVKVIFQAKRYQDSVSSSQIRDFRGAMLGRAEKAIFITTGRFTSSAKAEAAREGAVPIELIDGDKLVRLFEQRMLGLKQKVVYEVDLAFFEEFQSR